jgi:hypothetical protein
MDFPQNPGGISLAVQISYRNKHHENGRELGKQIDDENVYEFRKLRK